MIADGSQTHPVGMHVPVTLKHFQLLARLGRTPVRLSSYASCTACLNTAGLQSSFLFHEIEIGAEFYLDENDYIAKNDAARVLEAKHKVKVEASPNTLASSFSPSPASAANRGKKRPRRSAAVTVQSYAVPDSDDEGIMDEDTCFRIDDQEKKCKDTNLQLWIKHLGDILKSETRKVRGHHPFLYCRLLIFNQYTELKKRIEKSSQPDARVRIHRVCLVSICFGVTLLSDLNQNEFVKSLATNLRNLRRLEAENRVKFYGYHDGEDYSDNEDDDYVARRIKKRKY